MSRAFVKDRDDAPERVPAPPRSDGDAPITPGGLRELEASRAAAEPAEADRIARIIARVRVVGAPEDPSRIAFGATVTVREAESQSAGGQQHVFTIVGPDEIEVLKGRVGITSPIAQALLGARRGDTVVWSRPMGDRLVRVEKIDYRA